MKANDEMFRSVTIMDSPQKRQYSDEVQHVCKVLNIDPACLQQKSIMDFMDDGATETIGKIRYQHYEKRRQMKMLQIQDFIATLKKNNNGLHTCSVP